MEIALISGGGEGIRTLEPLPVRRFSKPACSSAVSAAASLSKPHGNRKKTSPVRVLGTTPSGFREDARARRTATPRDHGRRQSCEWDVNGRDVWTVVRRDQRAAHHSTKAAHEGAAARRATSAWSAADELSPSLFYVTWPPRPSRVVALASLGWPSSPGRALLLRGRRARSGSRIWCRRP